MLVDSTSIWLENEYGPEIA